MATELDLPFRLVVRAEPTFRGSIDRPDQEVRPGVVATFVATLVGDPDFVNAIALTVTGMSDTVTWSLNKDTLYSGESATLTVLAPVGEHLGSIHCQEIVTP